VIVGFHREADENNNLTFFGRKILFFDSYISENIQLVKMYVHHVLHFLVYHINCYKLDQMLLYY